MEKNDFLVITKFINDLEQYHLVRLIVIYTSILHWSFQICSDIHPKSFNAGLSCLPVIYCTELPNLPSVDIIPDFSNCCQNTSARLLDIEIRLPCEIIPRSALLTKRNVIIQCHTGLNKSLPRQIQVPVVWLVEEGLNMYYHEDAPVVGRLVRHIIYWKLILPFKNSNTMLSSTMAPKRQRM